MAIHAGECRHPVSAIGRSVALAGLVGVGKQEAFQLPWNASAVFYALTYLVMFAIPLFGNSRSAVPAWLRACALSGFLMTLLFVVVSIIRSCRSRAGSCLRSRSRIDRSDQRDRPRFSWRIREVA